MRRSDGYDVLDRFWPVIGGLSTGYGGLQLLKAALIVDESKSNGWPDSTIPANRALRSRIEAHGGDHGLILN